MSNAIFKTPIATNEPILNYAPGSAERKELQDTVAKMKATPVDVPMEVKR